MDWQGQRESDNVEDRRGTSGRRTAVIGGGVGTIVLALVYVLLGGDPNVALQSLQQSAPPATNAPRPAEEEQFRHFAAVVLAGTEDVWRAEFAARGAEYRTPRLVLYSQSTDSACGGAASAMGPFYCPNDERVFLDLGFFDELAGRFGAGGEFARAYVIAHEVGHHVQNLMGISSRVHAAEERDPERANALSVRLELQADCLAGVWASKSRDRYHLEPADIESALGAASAVGDDRLQRAARGYVTPDSFTHGSSAQRTHWFGAGYQSGRLEACDTFAAGASP